MFTKIDDINYVNNIKSYINNTIVIYYYIIRIYHSIYISLNIFKYKIFNYAHFIKVYMNNMI